jgi:hypothetical protein
MLRATDTDGRRGSAGAATAAVLTCVSAWRGVEIPHWRDGYATTYD